MFEQLTIGSWVIVGEDCAVRRAPRSPDGYLAFVFASEGREFELALAPGMLSQMAALAAE